MAAETDLAPVLVARGSREPLQLPIVLLLSPTSVNIRRPK